MVSFLFRSSCPSLCEGFCGFPFGPENSSKDKNPEPCGVALFLGEKTIQFQNFLTSIFPHLLHADCLVLVLGLAAEGLVLALAADSLVLGLTADGLVLWLAADGLVLWLAADGLVLWLAADGLVLGLAADGLVLWLAADGLVLGLAAHGLVLWLAAHGLVLWLAAHGLVLWLEETMNVEALSRAELLTLLSILEGELEAQDVVVHALRAQHRDSFIQERYGQYDLSDPFLALQRDNEGVERQQARTQPHGRHGRPRAGAVGPNPRAVLKLVMAHCKRMQERMMGQLAAAEIRHRRVISDLEGEKRRHAQDLAQSDDVTAMLQTERDKLLQQLEKERAAVQSLERERAEAAGWAEESLSQQQQLSAALSAELQRASSQAREEAQKVSELHGRLQEESAALETLRRALEEERGRADQLEARAESETARFDTDQEQMKARLRREEERSGELERRLEELRRRLEERDGGEGGDKEEAKEVAKETERSPPTAVAASATVQTESDGKPSVNSQTVRVSKVNGHCAPKDAECPPDGKPAENGGAVVENGVAAAPHSPLHPPPPSSHPVPHSPSSTASSSLSSSPISSPVLAKRLGSPGFHQSPYQSSVTQRFQAARHKFQSQAELEQQQLSGGSAPLSPRDLSPTTTPIPPPPENSSAKQLARNTVTQVLSRFTSQQAGVKLAPINSSPFGTDYRNLAGSPTGVRSPSSGPLSPGIRSPLTPRSERTHPPPIPPKRPGMSPTPGSPGPCARGSVFPELTGNCGQEGAKEPDLVLSSSS
ncbi:CTTNBP2 N-terminal-like protein [Merluccius polli]|uniref:CTTNBP2 N-terminal-like protein n=1 Tax=Merluccius polli TaxID=89951 RepID=A0AA47NUN6_MERPO|nr:CTTNBP2 N-terminal-like protein [Merluccius polli]